MSEREAQLDKGQWLHGKTRDTFAPFGPWVPTPYEIPDPQNLPIRSVVNGEERQSSETSDIIFTVADRVFLLDRLLIQSRATSSLPGPRRAWLPDGRYLQSGDSVTNEVEGLGSLSNSVVDVASS